MPAPRPRFRRHPFWPVGATKKYKSGREQFGAGEPGQETDAVLLSRNRVPTTTASWTDHADCRARNEKDSRHRAHRAQDRDVLGLVLDQHGEGREGAQRATGTIEVRITNITLRSTLCGAASANGASHNRASTHLSLARSWGCSCSHLRSICFSRRDGWARSRQDEDASQRPHNDGRIVGSQGRLSLFDIDLDKSAQ